MERAKDARVPAKGDAPGDEAPGSAEGATRVHGAPTRCPWCHDACAPEDAAAVVCQRCLSRHHAACWRDGGRCASCQGAAALGPVAPSREAAPAELALVRASRAREAVERMARRLGCAEGDAALALLDAAARELGAAPREVAPPLVTPTILVTAILALTLVAIVYINVAIH